MNDRTDETTAQGCSLISIRLVWNQLFAGAKPALDGNACARAAQAFTDEAAPEEDPRVVPEAGLRREDRPRPPCGSTAAIPAVQRPPSSPSAGGEFAFLPPPRAMTRRERRRNTGVVLGQVGVLTPFYIEIGLFF